MAKYKKSSSPASGLDRSGGAVRYSFKASKEVWHSAVHSKFFIFFKALKKGMFNKSSMYLMSFSFNDLSGYLPSTAGLWLPNLEIFAIGSLRNLYVLFLANNNLDGSIPSTVGGMARLQRLYLWINTMEGSIPLEICSLRNLGEMDLHNNKLSGPLPSCIGNLSNLKSWGAWICLATKVQATFRAL
ncbi:hypothetical protein RJ639_024055 [Escallonia herrerae]|uniref:Uncharacterized protein n=1 Tax=Escallonia herrerae TaxID=1293975 RepID=A0AA89AE60_9ASTE|nr:hypothetical protein RJ639_024055 [Escallonia herrerae]